MEKIKLVLFSAAWCKPCQTYHSLLPDLTVDQGWDLDEIDVEENPTMAEELGVQGLPTVAIVSNGLIKGTIEGAYRKERLMEKIGDVLGCSIVDNSSVEQLHISELGAATS